MCIRRVALPERPISQSEEKRVKKRVEEKESQCVQHA
jgi:hypothetical protein